MAAIDDLIAQIDNPELRDKIQQELRKVTKNKKFGLVFERHLPECTPLYDIPVKKGATVAKYGDINTLYKVLNIENDIALCMGKNVDVTEKIAVDELVTVAEFGEPIYPYLEPLDSVENAPDSGLWHTLIEADNYHALQLLDYLYHGKVDCIYIDPPYNTGAKDWKYNNDYVDGNDNYRHSKWLSMMEKRLLLAKKLLNPRDSVLIVTIDEKEYLHLGCLLEELFSGNSIQMITSMTNKKGQPRNGIFSRCEEYIYIIFIGEASVIRTTDNMLFSIEQSGTTKSKVNLPTIWNSLLRRGTHAARVDRPKLFYPIIINTKENRIVNVGDYLPLEMSREDYPIPEECEIAWPLHKDGSEGNWQMKPDSLKTALDKGVAKLGRKDKTSGNWSIVYLKRKQIQQLASGEIISEGKDEKGALILKYATDNSGEISLLQEPRSIWVRDSHDASVYGSTLIKSILDKHNFAFPKSLYAVRDTLRFFIASKPNALILDFFAGSGTTLHAVNLLNTEDGGNRRCILVTNNEVSEDEAKSLTKQGYKPGDDEWNKLGIARYVTWPRTVCSIEGHDINGQSLKGNYIGNDRPMADGFHANANFFKLGFLDKMAVRLGTQLEKLIPVLWMKANAVGKCPTISDDRDYYIFPENRFAILVNESKFNEFKDKIADKDLDVVYLVTDYEPGYIRMRQELGIPTAYQLYRDYLDNFRINQR